MAYLSVNAVGQRRVNETSCVTLYDCMQAYQCLVGLVRALMCTLHLRSAMADTTKLRHFCIFRKITTGMWVRFGLPKARMCRSWCDGYHFFVQ